MMNLAPEQRSTTEHSTVGSSNRLMQTASQVNLSGVQSSAQNSEAVKNLQAQLLDLIQATETKMLAIETETSAEIQEAIDQMLLNVKLIWEKTVEVGQQYLNQIREQCNIF